MEKCELVNQSSSFCYKVFYNGKEYLVCVSCNDLSLGCNDYEYFEADGVTSVENEDIQWALEEIVDKE